MNFERRLNKILLESEDTSFLIDMGFQYNGEKTLNHTYIKRTSFYRIMVLQYKMPDARRNYDLSIVGHPPPPPPLPDNPLDDYKDGFGEPVRITASPRTPEQILAVLQRAEAILRFAAGKDASSYFQISFEGSIPVLHYDDFNPATVPIDSLE